MIVVSFLGNRRRLHGNWRERRLTLYYFQYFVQVSMFLVNCWYKTLEFRYNFYFILVAQVFFCSGDISIRDDGVEPPKSGNANLMTINYN